MALEASITPTATAPDHRRRQLPDEAHPSVDDLACLDRDLAAMRQEFGIGPKA